MPRTPRADEAEASTNSRTKAVITRARADEVGVEVPNASQRFATRARTLL